MKTKSLIMFGVVYLWCLLCDGQEQINPNKSSNSTHNEKAIKSMLPPQLSYPFNESVIDIKYPVLIWIPPSPINGITVTYNLRLAEIHKGQTLAEALLQNPPLLNLTGLSTTFLNYPADATPLRPDGHYAWQIAASSGGQSLGVTDIWSFSIKKNENKKDDYINYPVVSKVSKERFYISHGVFFFAYNNMTNEKTLSYTIKSVDKSAENIKDLPKIQLRPGTNRLQVDLKKSGKLKNGNYYNLEIKDKKQQVYKLMYFYVES
jgi:hypothetical protein